MDSEIMKKINIFEPTFRKKEILEEIEVCLDKGWTGLGFTLKRLYSTLPMAD